MRVLYFDFHMDDPSKSTMRKLKRHGLAEEVPINSYRRVVNLNPYAARFLLPSDRKNISSRGIMVFETSWRKAEELRQTISGFSVKLPTLLPVNPVNYGKPGYLSSVEAAASALYITGFIDEANLLLSKFGWAQTFIHTNLQPLTDYSSCKTQEEMQKTINDYF
ncbi:MAG: DUF367 family protein [Thermoplasmataceae archaeon]